MTLNEKVDYKTVIECVKESNIFIGLKKTCLGVLDRGKRDKDNETGLKEGKVIEMSTTVLPLRDARSIRLNTYKDQHVHDILTVQQLQL